MLMMILGIALIVSAAALDSFFRERITEIGHKGAFFRGGAFDYNEYHKACEKRGWVAWPVYAMWFAVIAGIALLLAGFFSYFGLTPRHR